MATAEVTKKVVAVTLTLGIEEAKALENLLGRQTDGLTYSAYSELHQALKGL